MHVHKDGLFFLRDFFAAALLIAFIVLVYSGALAVPVAWLLDRAAAACPPPDKTLHRAEERKRSARELRIFQFLFVPIAVFAIVDTFLPGPFHIGFDRAASLVVAALVAGFLVIFIGPQSWDGRVGWRKWSFWVATITATVCVMTLTQALHLRNARGFLLPFLAAAIVFFWSFGLLRKIDRNNAEIRTLGVSRDFAGPMLESRSEIAFAPHKSSRRKRHKRRTNESTISQ